MNSSFNICLLIGIRLKSGTEMIVTDGAGIAEFFFLSPIVWPCVLLLSAQFILEDAKNYTFMTMGGLRVPGIEDPEEFNQTIASMKVTRGLSPVLWIQIHWDPDPAFQVNPDQDPRFSWQKLTICLSLGLLKGRPRYRRSLHPSKENIQYFRKWNLFTFFYFVGYFCSPGSGSNPYTEPDSQNWRFH